MLKLKGSETLAPFSYLLNQQLLSLTVLVMRDLLTALLLVPVLASAQELHTFKNGEVADADKINQNFQAIDQQGPVIQFGERVLGEPEVAFGLQAGTVEVTITDPSGLFSFGKVSRNFSDSAWKRGTETLLLAGETSVVIQEPLNLGLNEGTSLMYYATDLRGNNFITTSDFFSGLTSAFKRGVFTSADSIVIDSNPCDDYDFNGVHVNSVSIYPLLSEDYSYPTITVSIELRDRLGIGQFVGIGWDDRPIIDAAQITFETSTAGETWTRNMQVAASQDGEQIDVVYSAAWECDTGVVNVGPYQQTFTRDPSII